MTRETPLKSPHGASHTSTKDHTMPLHSQVLPPRAANVPPYQRLDSVWMSRVRRSGWQGWTLLAGGDDVMDQSILFWQEGKGSSRCLCLTLRVRQASDIKVRDHLTHMRGLEIYRGSIPYPRKQIVAGEVHPLDREWSLTAGTALDAHLDSVHIRYLPYEEGVGSDSAPYSSQGCLTVVMDNAAGHIDEVTSLLITLSHRLGIDTRLSTAVDLEYLYLRKMAWALRLCFEDANDGEEPFRRLTSIKSIVSRALGVEDVTRLDGYDPLPRFSSAYNPWTATIGTGEAGWPHWVRFDASHAMRGPLGHCWLGRNFDATNVGDQVARIIRSTGHLLSAEERWLRLGTPSQSILTRYGELGGTYLPLRLLHDDHSATLIFDIGLLRRVDPIAILDGDGAGALTPEALENRLPLDALERAPSATIYFKRAVPLMDALWRINLDHETDRRKVLEAFHVIGVQNVRGVPVGDLVRVSG